MKADWHVHVCVRAHAHANKLPIKQWLEFFGSSANFFIEILHRRRLCIDRKLVTHSDKHACKAIRQTCVHRVTSSRSICARSCPRSICASARSRSRSIRSLSSSSLSLSVCTCVDFGAS